MRDRPWLPKTPVVLAMLAICGGGLRESEAQAIGSGNAARLQRIVSLPLPGSVIGFVSFSPDGRMLLAMDRTGEVHAWAIPGWSRRTLVPPYTTPEAADSVRLPYFPAAVALSPDGQTIVAASSLRGDMIVRAVGGGVVSTFGYGAPVYSVEISPDGRLVAVGGLSGSVVVREVATGAQVADLVCDRQYVSVLAFSPDGRTLVAGYERPGNLMKAWSTSTWQETATFNVQTERIDFHDAAFTPDGRYLVVARAGGTERPQAVEMLDASTFQVARTISGQAGAHQMAFSPDGSLLASSWAGVDLREAATSTVVRAAIGTMNHSLSVAFSRDGTMLAFSVEGEGVQVWAVAR